MSIANILKIGDVFGEKALKEKKLTQTISIFTKTNCEFIVVEKKTYD